MCFLKRLLRRRLILCGMGCEGEKMVISGTYSYSCIPLCGLLQNSQETFSLLEVASGRNKGVLLTFVSVVATVVVVLSNRFRDLAIPINVYAGSFGKSSHTAIGRDAISNVEWLRKTPSICAN